MFEIKDAFDIPDEDWQRLSASGVTVNAVLPGPTRTEGVEAMFKSMGQSADDPKAERAFIDNGRPSSIIKRLARPEEVAEVVAPSSRAVLRAASLQKSDLQFLYRPCAAIVQRAQLGSNTPRPQPLALKSDAVRREADAIAAEPCR